MTSPHFSHLEACKDKYMGMKTLTLGSGLSGSMKIFRKRKQCYFVKKYLSMYDKAEIRLFLRDSRSSSTPAKGG